MARQPYGIWKRVRQSVGSRATSKALPASSASCMTLEQLSEYSQPAIAGRGIRALC